MARVPASRDVILFRVLVVGTSISAFGSYLNMVALNLFVYQATGSALQTGAFMALRLAAGFLAGLAGGTVAARLPRRPVMVACDLTQAAALVALALAPSSVRLGLLPVVAVAGGLLGTTSSVLLRSSVPDLVPGGDRVSANGLLVTGRAVAMTLGFAAGGLLVGWLGYRAAFLVDAGTFLVSGVLLAALPLRFPGRGGRPSTVAADPPAADSPAAGRAAARQRRRLAFAALLAVPAVLVIVVVRAADALGSASHNVGLPIYATQIRPDDPAGFVGNFFAVWAVGLLTAHQLVRRLHRSGSGLDDPRRSELAFVVGTCVMSAAFIVAFTDLPGYWVFAVALVAGAADGFTEISYTTRLQAEPDPRRGYFFGATAMAENGGFGVGMIVAAGLLEVWRPLPVAAVMHGGVVVLALAVALFGAVRRHRGRDTTGHPPASGDRHPSSGPTTSGADTTPVPPPSAAAPTSAPSPASAPTAAPTSTSAPTAGSASAPPSTSTAAPPAASTEESRR
ncbi:MFS transporter [Micromonospora cathayae]|uniref:MFS transporter n=1 Tax=Micromonospora cathayae TaxID=3028804 RepID=A0ABY7ZJ16_9ACTN|nr:MFS transporter [Micromonospora sp. HUAS 3]WDZ82890.1 MFS transporter [Micromonospora sp. HUAS 3]